MNAYELDKQKRTEAEQYRLDLLEMAEKAGVRVVHIFDDPKMGGVTVAYQKANPYRSGYMVNVAVATCSTKDVFSRKIGTQRALDKLFSGDFIQLPLLMWNNPKDLNQVVLEMFRYTV